MRAVDGLLTGWHEPEASHLLMLEAVAGRELLERSYDASLAEGYLLARVRRRPPDPAVAAGRPAAQTDPSSGGSPKKPVMLTRRPSSATTPTSTPATVTAPSGAARSQAKRTWSWWLSTPLWRRNR